MCVECSDFLCNDDFHNIASTQYFFCQLSKKNPVNCEAIQVFWLTYTIAAPSIAHGLYYNCITPKTFNLHNFVNKEWLER